ncbi:MAG: rhodanese-like domain-containing protein [Desulfobacteraceae bacterium]|nr:rhodanese-like domain-containing protein [Desulfobacteraceae bacterium]
MKEFIFTSVKLLGCLLSVFIFSNLVDAAPPQTIEQIAALNSTKHIQPDFSCFLTCGEVMMKIKAKKTPILIDVRQKKDFDLIRIPASLNLPLHSVKTKTVFKNNDIILFNGGHSSNSLLKECQTLRQQGFSSFVMYGGLNSWQRSNGKLEGYAFTKNNFGKMSPEALSQELKFKNWVFINASDTVDPIQKNLIPETIHIPFSTNVESYLKAIQKLPKTNNRFYSVLIFTREGEKYDKINKALSPLKNVFFLDKGLVGYEHYLMSQLSIWNRNTGSVIKTNKCGTCP